MKKTKLFFLPFLNLLAAISLHGQSKKKAGGWRLEAVGQNNSDETSSNNQAGPSLDQSSSPLMMFSDAETESPTDPTTDSRSPASRDVSPRGAATADSSSDAARGTASGLAEEGEDESSLTLDHFRSALAQNPTAARLVIVEDEENEGALSIQPRVAGTSKFALSKNKIVFEALRELLLTRHGGAAEVVASFFDGVNNYGTLPLSAERLDQILHSSDAVLNNSKKVSSPKTPPLAASENEATSQLDDSNIDDEVGADIRKYTHTLEKINLAEDLSGKSEKAVSDFKKLQKDQKAAMRKKREQKVLANAVESDTEGYMTPGTFLKSAVLKTVQAEMATSLLTGSALPPSPEIKKSSAVERNIEGYIRNAESQRDKALSSSLAAEKSKNKASSGKENMEQESAAYDAAAEAWNDVVVPYKSAWEVATHAHLDTRELTTFFREAEANELYWKANLVELEAIRTEHGITSAPTETHSSELAVAWAKSIDAYQVALSKEKEAGLENPKWAADLVHAQTQQAGWAAKTAELKFAREEAEIAAAKARAKVEDEALIQEEARLQAEAANREAAHIKAVTEARVAKERQEAEERADQEEANANEAAARNKVAAARARVNKAQAGVETVRQSLQKATARAAEPKATIERLESEAARLRQEFEVANTKARETQSKAEKEKTAWFRGTRSREEAVAAAEQAEREAAALHTAHQKAAANFAALTQAEEALVEATSKLSQFQREEKKAIRWASLTVVQRAVERATERASSERVAVERAAVLAEVKAIASRCLPGVPRWKDREKDERDRANEILALVRTNLWPSMSNEMKAFTLHPSEARMIEARKSASAFVFASASASVLASASVDSSAYACRSASTERSREVSQAVQQLASASAVSVYTSASAYASASASSSANAEEAAEAAEAASACLEKVTAVAVNHKMLSYKVIQENLDWEIEVAREAVTFAREVAKYRAAEEMRLGKQKAISGGAWERGVAAVKEWEARPCSNDWRAQQDRAKAILEVIKSQLWPSVSTALQAFIDHPSLERMTEARKSSTAYASAPVASKFRSQTGFYTTATAAAAASVYASSTLTTAEEAAEAAKAAVAGLNMLMGFNDRAKSRRSPKLNDITFQFFDETVARTAKLVEFASAVAAFKARQEAAQGSGSSSASAASGSASSAAGAGAGASASSSSSSSSSSARK